MARVCPRCRTDNPDDVARCLRCGAGLPSPDLSGLTATSVTPVIKRLPGGTRLGGKYVIRGEIGRGGMGVVYKAEDTQLKRTVALKFLSPDSARDPVSMMRLMNEARTASALNHPNICTIYEVGEAEGSPFIAMEYVEGRPLDRLIASDGLPDADVYRFGSSIAEGLQHAHEHAVIHRDLKTANIIVTPEGRAKILDFGLAKRLEDTELQQVTMSKLSLTQDGLVAGTLPYLAPELLHGRSADVRSDIWALGIVLFQMISGRLPFEGKTGFALTSAILRDPPAPLPPRTPTGLRPIVERCLEKDPEQRYQSASAVQRALEILARSEASGPTTSPAGSRRRRLRWALATTGLCLAGIMAATLLKTNRPTGSATDGRPRVSTGARASRNPEANEYFEKSMLFLKSQFDLPQARAMLEKALGFDPAFAEARAWYGFTFTLEIDSGLSNDSACLYRAEQELRRALRDDPRSARVHSSLAALYLLQGRKELVPEEALKGLEIDPNEPDSKNWLANYYQLNGEEARARELLGQILERDPLFFPARMNLADLLRIGGDQAAAATELKKILEQDPRNMFAHQILARVSLDLGDPPEARRLLERLSPADQESFQVRLTWALLLALEGKTAEARKTMDGECLKYAALSVFSTAVAAEFYAVTGEPDKALDWLERTVRNGDDRSAWFLRDPLLAKIRDLPRFKQIIASIDYRRRPQKTLSKEDPA
jgi:serine/threonine protein kinase/Flp pilus assembly protein TadD